MNSLKTNNTDKILPKEIKIFIIINIYFSVFRFPEKKHYWKSNLVKTPINTLMSF